MDERTRRRLVAAVITAVVAVSLLAPGTALGARSEADRLRDKLASLRKEAQRAGDAYSSAYWKLDKTNATLSKTNKDLKKTQARLAEASARLSTHAAEMYRQGEVDYLALLLTSETLDDMLVRLEYVRRMGANDAQVVDEVTALRAELYTRKASIEALRSDQAKQVAALKKKAASLDRRFKAIQSEYDATQRKYAAAVAKSGKSGSSRYPAGPNGMVFPVQGPCYYADTWGAARSGGRTHKGTDIMARTGTPCVAVLSGTVRAKSSSLGGKTIWLTARNGWSFYYAHLDSYVRSSGSVQAGELIARVGATGNARGGAPHLHFEIHPGGGSAVNPYPYLRQMQ